MKKFRRLFSQSPYPLSRSRSLLICVSLSLYILSVFFVCLSISITPCMISPIPQSVCFPYRPLSLFSLSLFLSLYLSVSLHFSLSLFFSISPSLFSLYSLPWSLHLLQSLCLFLSNSNSSYNKRNCWLLAYYHPVLPSYWLTPFWIPWCITMELEHSQV